MNKMQGIKMLLIATDFVVMNITCFEVLPLSCSQKRTDCSVSGTLSKPGGEFRLFS